MKVDAAFCLRRGEELIEAHRGGIPSPVLKDGLRVATQFRSEGASEDDIPLGKSHFGGRPHLPALASWPLWDGFFEPDRILDQKASDATRKMMAQLGQPAPPDGPIHIPQGCKPGALSFLAQINLAETPDGTGLLPATGWLCFFYDATQQPWGFDPRHRSCAQVRYFEGEADSLHRAEAPAGTQAFSPGLLRTELVATLPLWSNQLGIELEKPDSDVYADLAEKHLSGTEPHHRLLGWPRQVQGDMDRECQLVTNGIYCGSPEGYRSAEAKLLEGGVKDWVMLLQLDSDEDGAGWMWGDAGCLYFWIRKQDLAERRFEKGWAILQCY